MCWSLRHTTPSKPIPEIDTHQTHKTSRARAFLETILKWEQLTALAIMISFADVLDNTFLKPPRPVPT